MSGPFDKLGVMGGRPRKGIGNPMACFRGAVFTGLSRSWFPLCDTNNPSAVGELDRLECGAVEPVAQFAFEE